MLSQETIAIIKSTVPVLEQHGKTITTVFYKNMFKAHPELLNIFNHANQSQGRQQNALAGLVYAAAANIDNLELFYRLSFKLRTNINHSTLHQNNIQSSATIY